MHHRETIYLRHRQARFLRPDAHRWMRPDAAKFLRPGTDPADVYPALAQRRDRLQRQQDREIADAIEQERAVLAALRAELDEIKAALARRRLAQDDQKYSRDQPRVPGGNGRESGRWSSGSYGNGDRPRVVITKPDVDSGDAGDGSGADTGSGASLSAFDVGDVSSEAGSLNLFNIAPRDNTIESVQLAGDPPEQLINRHIADEHIGRTDEELIERIRERQIRGLFATTGMYRNDSFSSSEAARDLIKQTLILDLETVAKVVSGISDRELATHRFGYVTGREAILDITTSDIRIRQTYGVGVVIQRDNQANPGYRIITAYPRND